MNGDAEAAGGEKVAPSGGCTAEDVELILLRLDGNVDVASDRGVLSAAEHARAATLRTAQLRGEFIASRALLRRLLGRRLGLPASEVPLRDGPTGKPELGATAGPRLRFSTSRSGGLALFAISQQREVGVDVEALLEEGPTSAVERRFLSAGEQAMLSDHAGRQRLREVMRYWARKEAFLKATGTGLWAPWQHIDTSGDTVRLDDRALGLGADTSWCVLDVEIPLSHVAAVCFEGKLACTRDPGPEVGPFDP